jgi:vacuolar protein sorting-associated protein 13A/C
VGVSLFLSSGLNAILLYSRPPDSGGAFKVQIYSPYVIVNKTGLPFSVKSVRSNRTGPPQDVAGETQSGRIWVDFWELERN